MSATQVLEFETSFRANRFGEPAGMRIKIELGDDADLKITGTSTGAYDGESYIGSLTLTKEITGYGYEGGDECWINGQWVVPCPTKDRDVDGAPANEDEPDGEE